ncbi:unnamed protein product [Diplocarpon coronariae]
MQACARFPPATEKRRFPDRTPLSRPDTRRQGRPARPVSHRNLVDDLGGPRPIPAPASVLSDAAAASGRRWSFDARRVMRSSAVHERRARGGPGGALASLGSPLIHPGS